jgi:hypothetical protein
MVLAVAVARFVLFLDRAWPRRFCRAKRACVPGNPSRGSDARAGPFDLRSLWPPISSRLGLSRSEKRQAPGAVANETHTNIDSPRLRLRGPWVPSMHALGNGSKEGETSHATSSDDGFGLGPSSGRLLVCRGGADDEAESARRRFCVCLGIRRCGRGSGINVRGTLASGLGRNRGAGPPARGERRHDVEAPA